MASFKDVSLDDLQKGTLFEAKEVERMRCAKVYRLQSDATWCGRVSATSKLHLVWRFSFGPNGEEHMCEFFASMRSGKREVRFDRRVVLPASRTDRGSRLSWLVPGHAFLIEATDRATESRAAGAADRFTLLVDDQPFDSLDVAATLSPAEVEEAETQIKEEIMERLRLRKEEEQGAEAAAEGAENMRVVASNAFVKLYEVQLDKGIFGTGVLLRNESLASRRIEVAAVSPHSNLPDVVVGDVLVTINGKTLPRGASAAELQELVRSNPRYALTAVELLMWHKRTIGDDGEAGAELTVNCGEGPLGIEWARLVSEEDRPAPHIDGAFAAVSVSGQAAQLAIKQGDLLIGINNDPIPKHHPSATLLQKFSSATARGPLTLNLWRCYDPDVLDSILDQCASAVKHALAVNPSVSAVVPKRPQEPKPVSSCC